MQYWKAFEVVANAQKDLDRKVVMCIFLQGLKLKIQAEHKVSQFHSQTALTDKALELEERNHAWREGGIASLPRGVGSSQSSQPYQALVPTRMLGGLGLAAYGERGGKRQVEGFGERRRDEPWKLSQEDWHECQR